MKPVIDLEVKIYVDGKSDEAKALSAWEQLIGSLKTRGNNIKFGHVRVGDVCCQFLMGWFFVCNRTHERCCYFKNLRLRCANRSYGRNRQVFTSLNEAQNMTTKWLWCYNHRRPHSKIGRITPIQRLGLYQQRQAAH